MPATANLYEHHAREHKALAIATALPADVTAEQLRTAADVIEACGELSAEVTALVDSIADLAGTRRPSPETLRRAAQLVESRPEPADDIWAGLPR